MQQTHLISGPGRQGAYPERDMDCAIALRPAFAELAEKRMDLIPAAIGGEFSAELVDLIEQARAAGWSPEEAQAAIVQLAHEYAGAQGMIFD
jgi:hypothetical protein